MRNELNSPIMEFIDNQYEKPVIFSRVKGAGQIIEKINESKAALEALH